MKKGFEVEVYARNKEKIKDILNAGAIFCETIESCAKDKDVVIMATDGLWDNLSIKNILNLINQVRKADGFVECEILPQLLVKNAQVISYNK